ncbi:MAG: YraN family protein [Patescibacteria group bacterium]
MHKSKTSQTGAVGEDIACTFLVRKGFRIIEKNYRKPWGEIDIIAEKNNEVRFVEVKAVSGDLEKFSRESNTYRPEEQIHPAKLKKIVRTAQLYMAYKEDDREYQIDAVGVILDPITRKARCRLFEQIL